MTNSNKSKRDSPAKYTLRGDLILGLVNTITQTAAAKMPGKHITGIIMVSKRLYISLIRKNLLIMYCIHIRLLSSIGGLDRCEHSSTSDMLMGNESFACVSSMFEGCLNKIMI
jgi:hypothetical protein